MDEACVSKEDFVEIVAHFRNQRQAIEKIGQARGRQVNFANVRFSRFRLSASSAKKSPREHIEEEGEEHRAMGYDSTSKRSYLSMFGQNEIWSPSLVVIERPFLS